MRKLFSLIIAFVFLFPLPNSGKSYPSNNTYYVAPWGNDNNPGTFNLPWKTIQHAANVAKAGDTVYIRGGIYNEQVYISKEGNEIDYIIFSAYMEEKPIIDGKNAESTGVIINSKYFKFIGMEICNYNTGIWIVNSSNIEISKCKVYNVFYGIGIADGTHDFILENVEVYNFILYGIDASPSGGKDCYNGLFINCTAHSAIDRSQNVDGFAIGHGNQQNFSFIGCKSYDVFDGFDISAKNTTLSRCSAHHCWNSGYKLWEDNITLVNCLGYGNNIANVELDWDGKEGSILLQNCDFVDAKIYNIWVESSSDSLYMYNCILAGGDNIGLAFEEMSIANYHGDYNIFHNDNLERVISVAYTDEFSSSDIENGKWSSYSNQDVNSLVSFDINSLFVSLNRWDFHLKEGSIAIDAGTPHNAPPIDYDGTPRPQGSGYDIGAYEYVNEGSNVELYISAGINSAVYEENDYGFGYVVGVYNGRNETIIASYYVNFSVIGKESNHTGAFDIPPHTIIGLGEAFFITFSKIKIHLEAGGKEKTREGFVIFGFVLFLTNGSIT
ncbi:MAG: right-handed parallel beta-helix repeat-containing protein [Candidatus Thermoplasmatota archaeon]